MVSFDTGTTPDGARAAAVAAVRRGAGLIVGPLYGTQVAAAVAGAGGVPVLALASDDTDAAGAFVLGVTPRQATAAILGYARSRGVRRVAIDAGTSRWDVAAAAAARAAARDLDLTITDTDPDALFVPGDADALTAAARRQPDVQLLANSPGARAVGGRPRRDRRGVDRRTRSRWLRRLLPALRGGVRQPAGPDRRAGLRRRPHRRDAPRERASRPRRADRVRRLPRCHRQRPLPRRRPRDARAGDPRRGRDRVADGGPRRGLIAGM